MTEPEMIASEAPSISIVIPAYNHGRFLEATLRSVQAQTFSDWECVVVDDGSTDDTPIVARRIADEDARFSTVTVDNGGESAARNRGFLLTDPRSEYVTFMDSDDVWLPHALRALLSALEADPDAIGAHGLAEEIDVDGRRTAWSHVDFGRNRMGVERGRLVRWPLDRPSSFDVFICGNVLFPPGLVLCRRDAYRRAGRFDEARRGGADWDMLIRLSRFGSLVFMNEVILHYRRHASNMGAAAGIENEAWLVRCKGFHSPDNTSEHRRIARSGWRAYQRLMMRARVRDAADHLRERRGKAALGQIARVPVHAARLLRGSPQPKVIKPSEPW